MHGACQENFLIFSEEICAPVAFCSGVWYYVLAEKFCKQIWFEKGGKMRK